MFSMFTPYGHFLIANIVIDRLEKAPYIRN
jgi:hypothetical protein